MTNQALYALLSDMTLEEKAAQLAQIPMSACLGGVSEPTGPMAALHLTPESIAMCGSLIADGVMEPERYAAVVRALTDAHPHHIPPTKPCSPSRWRSAARLTNSLPKVWPDAVLRRLPPWART